MKAIKKLKSNRGATIIFAMAIFLVAVVIGASLLTISVSSAKSSASQLEDEQAYLAVASAARLLQKQIEGQTVKLIYDSDGSGGFLDTPNAIADSDVSTDISSIKELLKYMTNPSGEKTIIISANDSLEDHIDDVQITIKPSQKMDNAANDSPYYGFIAEIKNVPTETGKPEYKTAMNYYVFYSEQITNKYDPDTKKIVPDKRTVTLTWNVYGAGNGYEMGP